MKLQELLSESVSDQRVVVVYGGRFQPFHKGHNSVYQWLCKKFGKENVWIATSNKTNFDEKKGDVSPFTFKEKREIMTALYDIEPGRVVQCKNPAFKPEEIFAKYKGYDITYVAAVGRKDVDRYRESDFFKRLPSDFSTKTAYELDTLADGYAYYVEIPMKEKMSGTEARLALLSDDDHESVFKKYFGRYKQIIDELITAKLRDVKHKPIEPADHVKKEPKEDEKATEHDNA